MHGHNTTLLMTGVKVNFERLKIKLNDKNFMFKGRKVLTRVSQGGGVQVG
jgi:hypothetical protein